MSAVDDKIAAVSVCSKSIRQMKIVQFVCYPCHHLIRGQNTNRVAGKGFAVGASLQLH